MKTEVIGVIGAGVMGTGVAQSLSETGHQVILIDVSTDVLELAKVRIKDSIRLQALFKKRETSESVDEVLGRITFTSDFETLGRADFIIENVIEKWDVKKEVFSKLDAVCPAASILASNTSAIPITRIASVTGRASQVIGMHFMNPPALKSMVEVIPGYHTSEKTMTTAKSLLASMGKECIVVKDAPGFVSNRVLMLTINEAVFLVHEGVASAEDVDRIFKECFGHKMGPLETADMIGLDTILYSLEVLYENFRSSKYGPCPLLSQLVDAGRLGQKSGSGFYTYPVNG